MGTYWQDHWDRAATSHGDLRFASGWGERPFQDLLASLTDIARKLDLGRDTVLLDIGCGAGLFEIAYTPWVREILALDYSIVMVRVARDHTVRSPNVHVLRSTLLHLPFRDRVFDRVLGNSVIQYLEDPGGVKAAARELRRVTAKGGKVLLSLIPDAEKKGDFLEGYRRLGLSGEDLGRKLEENRRILWFGRDTLTETLLDAGFSSASVEEPSDPFQKQYYFDILLEG